MEIWKQLQSGEIIKLYYGFKRKSCKVHTIHAKLVRLTLFVVVSLFTKHLQRMQCTVCMCLVRWKWIFHWSPELLEGSLVKKKEYIYDDWIKSLTSYVSVTVKLNYHPRHGHKSLGCEKCILNVSIKAIYTVTRYAFTVWIKLLYNV